MDEDTRINAFEYNIKAPASYNNLPWTFKNTKKIVPTGITPIC